MEYPNRTCQKPLAALTAEACETHETDEMRNRTFREPHASRWYQKLGMQYARTIKHLHVARKPHDPHEPRELHNKTHETYEPHKRANR